jgi:hypothetical protein
MHERVTAADLIVHLINTYSTITSEVLEENHTNISVKWNPDDGVETIFHVHHCHVQV